MAVRVDGRDAQKAFRYLTAPPISEDDLKTVADSTLTASRIRADPDSAKRIRDTVLTIIDPHRFPWVTENRQPTDEERERAVIASAALAAARDVEARRRNTSKQTQEQAVKDRLSGIGMQLVQAREIAALTATTGGGTKADVVARLRDGRFLPIECKVSNSAVNSYKRLIHETGSKATTWYTQLGRAQVIPSAVLSGVFSTPNLELAQDSQGVFLFWQHRLNDLADFVKKAE